MHRAAFGHGRCRAAGWAARAAGVALVAALLSAPGASAQELLPAGPVRVLDGRVVLGGEITATAGRSDDVAFFNYTDYEHNALRTFGATLSGVWRPTPRVAFIGEVRSEDFEHVRPYAAYVRVRPWATRRFDIQAGRIPPVFGAFGRRAYTTDNPLVGYPLGYQYLTSLRPDAAPLSVDDILRMRGRGWQSSFPVGNETPAPGVPLVTAFRWDTGIQAQWDSDRFAVAAAVTAGTLSNPRLLDDNDGRQVSARILARPIAGLVAGLSAARGAWLARDVLSLVPASASQQDYGQHALGMDVEYSRAHWLVRSEVVWTRWHIPLVATGERQPLSAAAWSLEGRYRFHPRIFAAARVDTLGFSRVAGSLFDGRPTTWDAPVTRVEVGGGYYLQRNVTARATLQYNSRDGGRVQHRTFVTAQLAYWF